MYRDGMSSDPDAPINHAGIIERGGGSTAFGKKLEPPIDAERVKAWKRNDNIPGPYWQSVQVAELATLEELAAAAAGAAARRTFA